MPVRSLPLPKMFRDAQRDAVGKDSIHALAAGVMLRAGLDVPDHLEDVGRRFENLSMADVCREALRIDHKEIPQHRDEIVRSAMSGGAVADIFTNTVNAALLQAYGETVDTTAGWVSERDVKNFTNIEAIGLSEVDLKLLPRGQEADHANLSDTKETYKMGRFSRQFKVDEQDLLDDRFDALLDMPQIFGEGAKRVRPALIYSILLENAALNSDGIALFDASTHGNLATGGGSALSSTSLQAGITAIGNQALNDVQLNLRAAYLIVPHDIKIAAQTLLVEIQRVIASQGGTDTDPAIQGEIIQLRTDSRISAKGVVDPETGKKNVGLAGNWFLSTAAKRTIEVAYREGTNRMPVLRSGPLSQGEWGMWFDCSLDIGAKALDFRGMYKGAGA